MVVRGNIIDQQVDDLRKRICLLQQDRRANVEMIEAKKEATSEEIRALRESNKELRKKLKKSRSSNSAGREELSNLQREVLGIRSENDSLRVFSEKHKKELNKLKDEVRACKLESRRPNQEDSPLSRQIRMLENRLDKGMIKYNEAQSIRNTYEHIVKRLKDERISFDNELAALDRTLQSKQKDYEELLLLSGDAKHACEAAQQELKRSHITYQEHWTRRDGELRERHQLVKVRKQMLERQRRIEAKRKDIIDSQFFNDNVDVAGENAGRASLFMPGTGGSVYSIEDMDTIEEGQNKIDIYENAFRKIKEATGVSDVNEVIEKIIGQEGTTKSLMALTKQNQTKIEELTKSKEDLRKSVEEIKYSGSGCGQRRSMEDKQEENLTQSNHRLELCKYRCDSLSTTLISVKAGVKHLQHKVDIVREEIGKEKIQLSDETIVDVLRVSGEVLEEIVKRTEETREHSEEIGIDYHENDYFSHRKHVDSFDALCSLSEEEFQENRPFNQRIPLPSAREDPSEQSQAYDEGIGDIDEEELSRERVKKASSQIVLAQERKKTREGRRS